VSNTSFWDLAWSGWIGAVIGGLLSLVVALIVLRTTLRKDRESAVEQREADRELAAEQRAADLALAREERAHDAALRLVAGIHEAMVAVKYVGYGHPAGETRARLQSVVEAFDRIILSSGPALRDHSLESCSFSFRQSLAEYREWLAEERRRREALASMNRPVSDDQNVKAAYDWLSHRAASVSETLNAWRRGDGWAIVAEWPYLLESVPLTEID